MTDARTREDEIATAMRTYGLDHGAAAFLVALEHGEIVDAIPDVRGVDLLTPEERAESGFDLTLEDLEDADRSARRKTA